MSGTTLLVQGEATQPPCVMVPVFPGCQIACLLIVVSMEQCRYLLVSPCRDHQATIVLTYTFQYMQSREGNAGPTVTEIYTGVQEEVGILPGGCFWWSATGRTLKFFIPPTPLLKIAHRVGKTL